MSDIILIRNKATGQLMPFVGDKIPNEWEVVEGVVPLLSDSTINGEINVKG